jgi:L-arabinose isomerase
MSIAKLLAIATAFLPIAGVNAGKVNIAIAFLQILAGGKELNYAEVAGLIEAGIPSAGEDAAKITAIVQILKILAGDEK